MLVNIGKGIELTIDIEKLGFHPETSYKAVALHTIMIGLRNQLMDSHAGMTAKDNPNDYVENSRFIALKKLDTMYAGEVRTVSVREGDPVKAEAINLITKAIIAQAKSNGGKKAEADARKEAKELLAKAKPDNKFMVQARKNVEAAKALAADLDDLN